MARIFNSIRQRLLKEDRFMRYLIYAIGEILLVVIGILIALQVNNMNSDRKLDQLQVKYLKEITKNLNTDAVDIRFNIDFNETRLRSSQVVLDFLQSDAPYSDTLDVHFGNLLYTTRSVMNYSAFEGLRSHGIEIITNDSLRRLITNLYSFHYHNVIDFEIQDDHALQYQVVMPAVLGKVKVSPRPGVVKSSGQQIGRPIDLPALRQDDAFQNALTMNIDLRLYMLSNYRNLEEKVKECEDAIQAELQLLEH